MENHSSKYLQWISCPTPVPSKYRSPDLQFMWWDCSLSFPESSFLSVGRMMRVLGTTPNFSLCSYSAGAHICSNLWPKSLFACVFFPLAVSSVISKTNIAICSANLIHLWLSNTLYWKRPRGHQALAGSLCLYITGSSSWPFACRPCRAIPTFDMILRLNFREKFQKDSYNPWIAVSSKRSLNFQWYLGTFLGPKSAGQIWASRPREEENSLLVFLLWVGGFGGRGPDLSMFIKGSCWCNLNWIQKLGWQRCPLLVSFQWIV